MCTLAAGTDHHQAPLLCNLRALPAHTVPINWPRTCFLLLLKGQAGAAALGPGAGTGTRWLRAGHTLPGGQGLADSCPPREQAEGSGAWIQLGSASCSMSLCCCQAATQHPTAGLVAIHGVGAPRGLIAGTGDRRGLSGALHGPDSTECYRAAAAATLDPCR